MQMTEWNFGTFAYSVSADIKIGQQVIYKVNIYKRAPDNPKVRRDITQKCRKDKAVSIWCYIGPKSPGGIIVSIKAAAVWLAKLGLSAGDLENFFQAAADMGWEDELILEASQAACEILPPTEPSTYLVVKILRGIVSEYMYLPMEEAQQAVADYCDVDVTDIVYRTGLPFGDVYSASNDMDNDAWAFPVHDSGENIEVLSRQLEYALRAKNELFTEYAAVCKELLVFRNCALEGIDAEECPG